MTLGTSSFLHGWCIRSVGALVRLVVARPVEMKSVVCLSCVWFVYRCPVGRGVGRGGRGAVGRVVLMVRRQVCGLALPRDGRSRRMQPFARAAGLDGLSVRRSVSESLGNRRHVRRRRGNWISGALGLGFAQQEEWCVEQVETKVFVVASPQIAAIAIARAIRNAGWAIGGTLGSPSGLADSSVAPNDVIVVTENMSGQVSSASTETVMITLRRVFPTVGLVLIAVKEDVSPCEDARTRVMPGSTSIPCLSRELTDLSGRAVKVGYGLTARHLEILQMIACGASTCEAGASLGIAPKTVNNHLSAAYQRLGTRSLTHAVLVASRAGLIDPGLG